MLHLYLIYVYFLFLHPLRAGSALPLLCCACVCICLLLFVCTSTCTKDIHIIHEHAYIHVHLHIRILQIAFHLWGRIAARGGAHGGARTAGSSSDLPYGPARRRGTLLPKLAARIPWHTFSKVGINSALHTALANTWVHRLSKLLPVAP